MSARADPLRNTLDHLALDPRAKDDRKYLESMLRRLGYTEVEIRQALGTPVQESRVIELEYRKARSGAGAFTVVEEPEPEPEPAFVEVPEEVHFEETAPEDEFTFTPKDTWTEGSDEAWEPVDDDWQEVAVEEVEEVQEVAYETEPVEEVAWEEDPAWEELGAGDEAVHHGWIPLDGDGIERGADVDNPWEDAEAQPAVVDEGEWAEPVEFIERDTQAATAWPETEEPAWPEPEWETEEAQWPETPESAAPAEAWAEAPAEAQWPEAEPVADDAGQWVHDDSAQAAGTPFAEAFTYGDYTLYTRMVDLSTGRQQQIYFFAKSEPKSGEPCAMPEGYMVEENSRTGLPFLRRDSSHVEEAAPEAEGGVATHCMATTKAGEPCKKAPLEGSEFCNIHKGRD